MDEDKISVFLNPKTLGIHSGQEIEAAYLTTSSAKIISSMPLSSTERGLYRAGNGQKFSSLSSRLRRFSEESSK
jgi:hypothetical protein